MATADILTSTSLPATLTPAAASLKLESVVKNSPVLAKLKESLTVTDHTQFNPKEHLQVVSLPKTHSMKELGYPEGAGVSPIGVSEPFQLFSPEAIQQMRAEILNSDVWTHYQFTNDLAQCQLRGFAPE
jgi:hypothetical protein